MDPATASTTDTAAACVRRHQIAARHLRATLEEAIQLLEVATDNRPCIEQEIRRTTVGDPNGRRRAAMLKAVSLPSQAATLASLTASLVQVIALERQAWGIQPGWTPETDDSASLTEHAPPEVDLQVAEIRCRVMQRLQELGPQA